MPVAFAPAIAISRFRRNDCDPKIHVLFGRITQQPDDWTSDEFENKNNHSLVTRVDVGQSLEPRTF